MTVSSTLTLSGSRLQDGVWHGELSGAPLPGGRAPDLVVTWRDEDLGSPEVAAVPEKEGRWTVRFAVPAACVTDGVQSFTLRERVSGRRLAAFALIAGEPAADDLVAEVALLRAELDMLKRAFRAHCADGDG